MNVSENVIKTAIGTGGIAAVSPVNNVPVPGGIPPTPSGRSRRVRRRVAVRAAQLTCLGNGTPGGY